MCSATGTVCVRARPRVYVYDCVCVCVCVQRAGFCARRRRVLLAPTILVVQPGKARLQTIHLSTPTRDRARREVRCDWGGNQRISDKLNGLGATDGKGDTSGSICALMKYFGCSSRGSPHALHFLVLSCAIGVMAEVWPIEFA